MQTATSTLAAAIASFVRRPVATAVMAAGAAYDTLTPVVEAVTIDRNLATDLPDAAQQSVGGSVGECTLELGGDYTPGVGVADVFSPYRAYLGGAARLQQLVTVRLGMLGSVGVETLPAFVGRVRQTDSGADRKVRLSGLDASELLRNKVSLAPALKSDPGNSNYGPGVTPAWCADQVWRQNGYVWRTPPDRAGIVLGVTMEGSAQPHVGTIATGTTFGRHAAGPTASGPVVITPVDGATWNALDRNDPVLNTDAFWTLAAPAPVNGGDLFVEWYRVQVARPSSGSYYLFSLQSFVPGTDGIDIRISSAGVLVADYTRGSTVVTSASLGTLPTTTAYLALHFAFTAAGVTINCRINATTTSVVVANAAAPTDMIRRLAVEAAGALTSTRALMGQVNVTTEPFSSGMWRDSSLYTLTPTVVVDPFLGEMTGAPPVDGEAAWPVLQEIAEAEQGAFVLMEDATIRFYNRDTLQAAGTAVATITAAQALKTLAFSEAIDTVRNTIRVPAAQYQAQPANVDLWTLQEVISLAPGQVRVFPVQLPGPLVAMFDVERAEYPNPDGSGALTAATSRSYTPTGPTRGYITIGNPTGGTLWLVDPGGAAHLKLIGRCIVPSEDTFTATATDTGSAGTYGDQPLDVAVNRFRQTGPAATALAALLLSALTVPHALVSGVEVVGDPRRQLTDRVTIIDPATGLARDFMTVGVRTSFARGSGLTQSLALRERGAATTGMTGTLVWDSGDVFDGLDGWA